MVISEMEWIAILVAFGTMLVGSALTFAIALFWRARDARLSQLARLAEVEKQNALLKQAVEPLSAVLLAALVEKLTHFHCPRVDALLLKIGPPSSFGPGEEEELAEALRRRMQAIGPRVDEVERIAAEMLPLAIRWAKEDNRTVISTDVVFQVVAVPVNMTKGNE